MSRVLLGIVGFFMIIISQNSQATQSGIPNMNHPIKVLYINWRGETAVRSIVPLRIYFGSTEYHQDEQWLLEVWDIERDAARVYALKDIKSWFVQE